jgi:PST family polysaccharide transporter
MMRWTLLAVAVTIIAFIIGIRWGIIGVATAYAIRSYLLWYPAITIPGRLIDLSFWEFFGNVIGIFACSIGMSLFVWLIGSWLPEVWPYWLQLAIQVSSGALIFLILIQAFKLQAYDEAKALVTEQLKRRGLTAVPKVKSS